jgi:hypothetical protein
MAGDTCNKIQLSMTRFFCDTSIPYHQAMVAAISAIYDRNFQPKIFTDITMPAKELHLGIQYFTNIFMDAQIILNLIKEEEL